MNKLRVLKKTSQIIKSAEKESRDIIENMYPNPEKSLQIEKSQWDPSLYRTKPKKQENDFMQNNEQRYIITYQIFEIIVSALRDNFPLKISTTFFFKQNEFQLFYTSPKSEKVIKIKQKLTLKKLKYWINNVYQKTLNNKFYDRFLLKQQSKDLHHISEEKFHIPKLITKKIFHNKNSSQRVVRQMIFTCDLRHREYSPEQTEMFCTIISKNGEEKVYSYSMLRDHLTNILDLKSIKVIKIVVKSNKKNPIFFSQYHRHKYLPNQKQHIFDLIKHTHEQKSSSSTSASELAKIKHLLMRQLKYEQVGQIMLFELVHFLDFERSMEIHSIKIEWIIDQQGSIIMNSIANVRLIPKRCDSELKDKGLLTLYQKINKNKIKQKQEQQQQNRIRIKKQQKRKIFRIATQHIRDKKSLGKKLYSQYFSKAQNKDEFTYSQDKRHIPSIGIKNKWLPQNLPLSTKYGLLNSSKYKNSQKTKTEQTSIGHSYFQ